MHYLFLSGLNLQWGGWAEALKAEIAISVGLLRRHKAQLFKNANQKPQCMMGIVTEKENDPMLSAIKNSPKVAHRYWPSIQKEKDRPSPGKFWQSSECICSTSVQDATIPGRLQSSLPYWWTDGYWPVLWIYWRQILDFRWEGSLQGEVPWTFG